MNRKFSSKEKQFAFLCQCENNFLCRNDLLPVFGFIDLYATKSNGICLHNCRRPLIDALIKGYAEPTVCTQRKI